MTGSTNRLGIAIILALAGAIGIGIAVTGLVRTVPLLVVSTPVILTFWVLFATFYELPLAMLLVGFFVYPVTIGLLGMSPTPTLTTWYYAFLASSALAGGFARHPTRVRGSIGHPITFVVMALALWTLMNWASLSWGNDLADKRIGFMFVLMIGPFFASQFVDSRELRRVYLFSLILVGIGSTLAILALTQTDATAVTRVSVHPDVSPLGFAYSCGIAAIMSLSLLLTGSIPIRSAWLYWLLLAAAAIVIIASGSRGPAVALAAGMGILAFRGSRRLRVLAAIGIVVIAGWATLPLAPTVVQERLAPLLATPSRSRLADAFSESRGNLWRSSLSAWATSPLLGVGLGNLQRAGGTADSFSHNVFLEAGTELGVIGLAAFLGVLWILGRSALRLWQSQDSRTPLAASIVALLVSSLTTMMFSGQLQSSVDFWIVSGIVAGMSLANRSPSFRISVRRTA